MWFVLNQSYSQSNVLLVHTPVYNYTLPSKHVQVRAQKLHEYPSSVLGFDFYSLASSTRQSCLEGN